ncbi:hypothetical protein [Rheinheimera sp.]|uniref:hypothetical protein n=1 Tax=Rheinheimera sp. TaxID=1869214 RepID=UPI00307EC03E
MTELIRIEASNGNFYIKIVGPCDGSYSLEMYAAKYDDEEEKHYFVRVSPDPSGRFGDIALAKREAELILN